MKNRIFLFIVIPNNKRTLLNRKQGRAEETTDVVADEDEVVYTNFNQFGSSSVTRLYR